jgi:PAS domain S-box-containing protein
VSGDEKLPKKVRELADTVIEALDSAGIGFTITAEGPDGLERLYSNERVAEIMGYSRDEMNELPPMAVLAPGERERLQKVRETWLAGGEVAKSFSTVIVRKDGSHLPVEIGLASTRYDGKPTTVSFLRDITAYHEIEDALRASETRFKKLAEAAPDSITVAVDGRLVYCNPATARILGAASADELYGIELRDLIAASEVPVMMQRLQRVARGEHPPPLTYHSRRRDGSPLLMEISSSVIEWEGKRAILGYGRDVTERRRVETELMQADRMATVGTLAAGVAHEINNPLTYVLLHLERLRKQLPELVGDRDTREQSAQMLDEALEGGERVRTIVRDLLAFSRSSTDEHQAVELGPVLESASKIASTAHGDRIDIAVQIADEPLRIHGDEARLGQVALNLVVNAVQAFGDSPPPDAKVVVSATRTGDRIVVTVEDNGPGAPPDVLTRAFDPFFTTKPVGTGTGLGLPISRSIVESLGGTMELSNRQRGVRARVTLPVATAPAAAAPAPERNADSPGDRRPRVLVVDDEELIGRAIAGILRKRFDVTTATHADQARALLAEPFDLILCDINMPELSGVDLYQQVTAERPELADRFVFITGGARTERDRAFVEAEADRVIGKPFDPRELLARLEQALGDG